jgi:hypothetical protein
MSEWVRDESLIVLSLPVTYWDYLGWKDTFADPIFTARQKGYAAARRDRKVYTPQMVINGVQSGIGSERKEILRSLDEATAIHATLPIPIRVAEENGLIIIDVASGFGEAGVWLLPVRRRSQVAIQRGENAGYTEAYTNIARGLYFLGSWSGQPARFQVPLEAVQTQDADSYVVLLQKEDGRPRHILGAAKGPDR